MGSYLSKDNLVIGLLIGLRYEVHANGALHQQGRDLLLLVLLPLEIAPPCLLDEHSLGIQPQTSFVLEFGILN